MQAVRRTALVLVLLSAVLVSQRAVAACNKPDLLDAVPPNGASDVPKNAKLFARYASNADYLDEPITLEEVGQGEQTLGGAWNPAETLLSVAPDLHPGSQYTVKWPRLRGVNSANLGRSKDVDFTVGDLLDEQAPEFQGLTGVDWDVGREKDECTDSLEERYTFQFDLGAASDDGGRDSLMLVVFQTQGPHIASDAPEPILLRRLPGPGQTVPFVTTVGEGVGDVCFAAVVRDLTGKASASGAKEVCTTTVEPPFFNGCSTRSGSPAPAGAVLLFVALAALGTRRRR